MDEPDPSVLSQSHRVQPIPPPSPESSTAQPADGRIAPDPETPKQTPAEAATPDVPPIENRQSKIENEMVPARMLNEFVYCPRLFYYEHVEGVFVESADTLRGAAIHQRVDQGEGALPPAASGKAEGKRLKAENEGQESPAGEAAQSAIGDPQSAMGTIHSRSVQMGSERLGVTAKMDLVETRVDPDNLLALEVCPVDYKAGAPREGADANELWDTDQMQLGLQALILRDNGYTCREGVVYYRATKQRIRLEITAELEAWILAKIAEARQAAAGAIPAPLLDSPKCPRCSLAPICLPDETRLLSVQAADQTTPPPPAASSEKAHPIRRLIVARDDQRALYLNTPGLRVGCKAEVLQVKEKEKVVEEVRLRDVSHVALFGNIQITTQAIHSLCHLEAPVTYFSMGGWFYGITRGHELKNVFLRMEQFRLARDAAFGLRLACRLVHGKIRNHRTLLMRNHLEPPPETLLKLKRASEDALEARSLGELLGIEGAAAGLYFSQFSGMIKAAGDLAEAPSTPPLPAGGTSSATAQTQFNFNFTHRNRRPPTDPVNAMLSLAYSLLAKDCTLAVMAVGFDPYVGYYHQPRFGRPALALDLMEEFRPLIAESVVLASINNRAVTETDFVRAGQAVNLTAAGRKRFFQMYEQRINRLLTHPLFDYKVSYRRALELQARILAKTLTGEIPAYEPLMTR